MARLSSRPAVSLISHVKPKKKVFGADGEDTEPIPEPVPAQDTKTEENDEDDSDDDAPEEEGFADARQTVKKQQLSAQELLRQQRAEEREQRRERDETLKRQKEASQVRQTAKEQAREEKAAAEETKEEGSGKPVLLDASLLEQLDSQALVLPGAPRVGTKTTFGKITKKNKKKTLHDVESRLAAQTRAETVTVVNKGPVTVAVLRKNSSKRSMMPPKARVVDEMRARWLRESEAVVERRPARR